MLVESGISVAPHERSRAPDAKHMTPAPTEICSRLHRAEPLPEVTENAKDASSQETDTDADKGDENNAGSNKADESDNDNEDDNSDNNQP